MSLQCLLWLACPTVLMGPNAAASNPLWLKGGFLCLGTEGGQNGMDSGRALQEGKGKSQGPLEAKLASIITSRI